METEILKIKTPRLKYNRSLDTSLYTFDLPALIKKMKKKDSEAKGELNAMILLKRPDRQIVLARIHEGTEIKSFQSNDSITFQIIEGKLKFRNKKNSVILDKGQLLTLHENINYKLTTKEETVLLLTIANSTLHAAEI